MFVNDMFPKKLDRGAGLEICGILVANATMFFSFATGILMW